MELEAPTPADAEPARQFRQVRLEVAADDDEYVPKMQFMQVDELVALVAADHVPGMHPVHENAP